MEKKLTKKEQNTQPKIKVDSKNLTPYQKYLQEKTGGKTKIKYFEFYNDVKHMSHQIYDW